jgi:prepilin-type N-terminal cleavage/methylation domain-containing protein/prepilin-type processing-associated H-X9-DG protein
MNLHRRLARKPAFTLVELPATSTCKREAFTLVELLVVIGIIAVLIGILLPVLSSARKTANTTKCASALRQIAYAFTMYSKENRDKYPVLKWENYALPGPSEARSLYWQDFLMPYTARNSANLKDQLNSSTDATKLRNIDAFRKSVFWSCPEWTGSYGASAGWSADGISIFETGYGYNWMPQLGPKSLLADANQSNSAWDAEGAPGTKSGQCYNFQKWAPYAQRCLVTEGTFWKMRVLPTALPTGPVQAQPVGRQDVGGNGGTNTDRYRHGKYPPTVAGPSYLVFDDTNPRGIIKFNILYADGHVDLATSMKQLYRAFILRDP